MDIIFYCDESCHIQFDNTDYMSLVAVFCSKSRVKKINRDIRKIKNNYNISPNQELKWTKVSKSNVEMYKEVIRYISEKEFIRVRGLLAKKRTIDELKAKNKTYDQWYHSIYFYLLEHPIKLITSRNVDFGDCLLYIDKKDIYTKENIDYLAKYLERHFFYKHTFKAIAVESHEHQLVQVADIIAGALTYRKRFGELDTPKSELCSIIENNLGSLCETSPYKQINYNLLIMEKEEL